MKKRLLFLSAMVICAAFLISGLSETMAQDKPQPACSATTEVAPLKDAHFAGNPAPKACWSDCKKPCCAKKACPPDCKKPCCAKKACPPHCNKPCCVKKACPPHCKKPCCAKKSCPKAAAAKKPCPKAATAKKPCSDSVSDILRQIAEMKQDDGQVIIIIQNYCCKSACCGK